MAYGKGKYDDEALAAFNKTGAEGVLLMVFNGDRGSSFSYVGHLDIALKIPAALKQIAKEMEEDLRSQ